VEARFKKDKRGCMSKELKDGVNIVPVNSMDYWWKRALDAEKKLVEAEVKASLHHDNWFSEAKRLQASEEKLKIAVEALEHYDTTCYDGHDYSAKDISKYAREALEKINQ
jgi:hypothetical protein